MNVIGLMSGTSADGVDAALVDIQSGGGRPTVRLLAFETFPYPTGLRERLLATASAGNTADVCHLNAYLGELFADAAVEIARRAGLSLTAVDLIGSHGQTIHHLPAPKAEGTHRVRSTLQIGAPAVIAERTGVTTIADFRPRDMAAGGEGAPLTPLVHHVLFAHPTRGRAILNLGGIANVTVLPAGADAAAVTGFDTGPANVLLDEFVRTTGLAACGYDAGGRLAAAGAPVPDLLAELLQHPFVRRTPPKSTGRETFGPAFVAGFRERLRHSGGKRARRSGDLDGLHGAGSGREPPVVRFSGDERRRSRGDGGRRGERDGHARPGGRAADMRGGPGRGGGDVRAGRGGGGVRRARVPDRGRPAGQSSPRDRRAGIPRPGLHRTGARFPGVGS